MRAIGTLLLAMSLGGRAAAQAPEVSERAPKAPRLDPSARRHDGLYLRFGLGPAWGRVVSKGTATDSDVTTTYRGWGSAAELALGGTVGAGVVLGGGAVLQDISSPSVESETSGAGKISTGTDDRALGFLVAGFLVDWFPDPRGGGHGGALLGVGAIGLRDSKGDNASGGGASLFAGYDFWIGEQWSLGVQGRLVAVSAERDVPAVHFEDEALGFQIAVTAVYH